MGLKKGLLAGFALLFVAYLIAWIGFEMDHRTRAASLFRSGEYKRAEEMFTQVINGSSKKEDIAEGLVARGNTRLRLGDLSGATDDANQALASWPAYSFAFILRAEARASSADTKGALEDCNSAVQAAPEMPWPYWCRGNARRELGAIDDAIADYNKAIDLKPSMFVQAWDHLRPLRPVAAFYVDRSIAKRLRGDLEGARADCDAAILSDNRYSEVFLNRGLVYMLQRNEAEARTDFDRFASQRPAEKSYLDAEISWAKAGVAPTASQVFLARGAERAEQQPIAAAETSPSSGSSSDQGAAPATEAPAPAPQEGGLAGFLKRPLPRIATLVSGLLFTFVFTGSFLIMKDMQETLAGGPPRNFQTPLALAIRFIRFRRTICLLAGLGLIAAYFFQKQLPMFGAIILGLFFLSTISRLGRARQLVTDSRGQRE